MKGDVVVAERVADGRSRITREQQSVTELGTARYSAGVRDALVIAFLLTIVSVPLIDGTDRLRADPSSGWFDITATLRSWREIVATQRSVMTWIRLTNPWRLRESEDTLTHRSSVGTLIRPWIQWFLTGWIG